MKPENLSKPILSSPKESRITTAPSLTGANFGAIAADYDRFRPNYPDALFDLIGSLCADHERAVDIGMGTGQLTVPLAHRFDSVIGVDHDPLLEPIVRQKHRSSAVKGEIQFNICRAEEVTLPTAAADLITIGNAIHWWWDSLPNFWRRISDALKPGGIVLVCRHQEAQIGFPDVSIDRFLQQRFNGGVIAPYIPTASAHNTIPLREMPFPFVVIPTQNQFCYPSTEQPQAITKEQLFGYLNTWSASKRFLDVEGYLPTDRIADELRLIWPDGETRPIRWAIEYIIGRRD